MDFTYPVKIEAKKDQFIIRFKDLPYVIQKETPDLAITVAKATLEKHIEACMAENQALPEPSPATDGDFLLSLDAHVAAKAALYVAFREAGYSKSALAREMNVDNKEVRRMLSFESPTKLPRIIEALNILGYKLSVSLEPAA